MVSNQIFCIFHKGCMDGYGAAWTVKKWAEESGFEPEFHPAGHGDDPPDVTNKRVVIVDFSYPRKVLLKMAVEAASLLVIDHHKSAEVELKDLPFTIFDNDQSGAVMAWRYFFPHHPIPAFLEYIQDRDLWQWRLPFSREINAAMHSYPLDFDTWSEEFPPYWYSIEEGGDVAFFGDLINEGKAILRAQDKLIRSLSKDWAISHIEIAGYTVPAVNCPVYKSEIGHVLAQGRPFAAVYYDTALERVFELRSDENGLDVSEIAIQFGGGGHKRAAGFSVPKPAVLIQIISTIATQNLG